jgi:hypothetical protein
LPVADLIARLAACMTGPSMGVVTPKPPWWSVSSHRQPGGVWSLHHLKKALVIFGGVWFATRRKETLALACAGMTVLAPFAGVAAPDAVDLGGRAAPLALGGGEALLADVGGGGQADALEGGLGIELQGLPVGAFLLGERDDILVEARDGDRRFLSWSWASTRASSVIGLGQRPPHRPECRSWLEACRRDLRCRRGPARRR